MKKFNKLQRHTIYCLLLYEATESYLIHRDVGFCMMWRVLFDEGILYSDMEKILPELYKKRTRYDLSGYYFYSWQERREALIICIQETYP